MMPNSNTDVALNDILAEMGEIEVSDAPVNDATQTSRVTSRCKC